MGPKAFNTWRPGGIYGCRGQPPSQLFIFATFLAQGPTPPQLFILVTFLVQGPTPPPIVHFRHFFGSALIYFEVVRARARRRRRKFAELGSFYDVERSLAKRKCFVQKLKIYCRDCFFIKRLCSKLRKFSRPYRAEPPPSP